MRSKFKCIILSIMIILFIGLGIGANVHAAGTNLSTATPINLNETFYSTLDDFQENDYYKFSLSNNSIIEIYAETSDHDESCNISVYDEEGERLFYIYTEDPVNWGYESVRERFALNKGTYYLKVEEESSDTTNYSAKVSVITKSTDNIKVAGLNNCFLSKACSFKIGNKLTSIAENGFNLMDWDECHYYKFKVENKRKVIFKFSVPLTGDSREVWFRLYNSSGKAISDLMSCNTKNDFENKYTYSKILKAGTYYIGVTTPDYSVPYTIKTAYKPYATKITSLASKSKNSITVKWKKKSPSTGYQIQYSRYKNFKNAKSIKVNGSKSIKKITGLKGGKRYYVRVRRYMKSFGATYYSNWSAKKSVVVNNIKSVKLSKAIFVYNGEKRKPTVIVRDSNGNKVKKSNYTVTYSKGRKYVGKYKVTVKMKGKYHGTYTRYFKIVPKKTSIKKLSKTTNSITVKWNKRKTQTTGYEIRYSRYKNFSKYGTKRVAAKYTSKKIKGLKASTKYYVKIRTYKKVNGKRIYSGWSDVKTVKTKAVVYTPKSVERRWTKSGSYSYKFNEDYGLIYKKSNGQSGTIVSQYCGTAIAVGPKVYYYDYDETIGDLCIFVYNVNKGTNKLLVQPSNDMESVNFLGYYKNFIYWSTTDYEYGFDSAYKMNVNTSKRYTVNKLTYTANSVQAGKYLALGENSGDIAAYPLQIYNVSTGKFIKTISNCATHVKINGKLYYAIQGDYNSSGNCIYKIYKSDMSGANRKKLTEVKCPYEGFPALGKNYVYYMNAAGTCYKKNYSTGKVTEITWDEYVNVGN